MELRELRYFIAVAEELNFSAAAKRLHLSQPPLTAAIKKLEAELAVRLFNRTSRKVELTEAGAHLLAAGRRLLNHARQVADGTRVYGQGKREVLRLAFFILVTRDILPMALSRFRKNFPNVYLEFQHLRPEDAEKILTDDLADAVIANHLPTGELLASKSWLRTSLVAALPPHHPLTVNKKISIADLRDEQFILSHDTAPQLTQKAHQFCRAAGGFEPRIKQYCSETLGALALVAAGDGVSIFDSSIEWTRTGATFIPFKEPTPAIQWGVAWRRDKETPALRGLLRELNRAFAGGAIKQPRQGR
ncbi:MAG: LysR family transcriptional regulator [Verrucomicrobiales bacterium]|jgi:DNA-binding transcriptional LysR family regulator|nr:LysR family transcriptional regulator [Verrucomicrobiales bacterium]